MRPKYSNWKEICAQAYRGMYKGERGQTCALSNQISSNQLCIKTVSSSIHIHVQYQLKFVKIIYKYFSHTWQSLVYAMQNKKICTCHRCVLLEKLFHMRYMCMLWFVSLYCRNAIRFLKIQASLFKST